LDDDTSSVDFSEVNAAQDGVLSFDQLLACGFTASKIKNMVQSKRWQRIHRGIFATFSGPLGRRAAIWAAILGAGHNAVASHYTAAELCGLNNSGRHTIHVTIPNNQRGRSLAGVTVHRFDRIMATAHPTRVPPQTRIEETILDLTDLTTSPDQVVGLLSAACGHRMTTPGLLHQTALVRPRLKWRELIDAALSDVADGTHPPLERYYYRDVERAHGLPTELDRPRSTPTAVGSTRTFTMRGSGRWSNSMDAPFTQSQNEADISDATTPLPSAAMWFSTSGGPTSHMTRARQRFESRELCAMAGGVVR
jgi:hypothetical protein